ncbi:MAG: UDP-N-acetylmuramate dehydrogenase [Bacteroidales bacterium]|nr:UDP-N-acetylmuramate dehydrogenase [Bacteroidales bacterium]MBO7463526.1 UDP-N-acetylmuramate dehydrogenase [Bacteroidales bacterium]MBO7568319.1 UDP-N-acetylmuramate dehydrogenase [Bacteroidales bacterium]MBP5682570.1 UDP-N-acetylmuramate dehydrogenase [Bacteroidales bacterium]
MIFYTDYSLEGSNTFNIKAKANVFYEVGLREDLDSFVRKRKLMDMPRLVLGNGSNVLFVKKRFKGVVLKNEMKGIDFVSETDDEVLLKVASGEDFDEFIAFCLKKHLHGAENLSGIPGSVGGAVVQNIGAYGQELRNLVRSVEYFDFEDYEMHTIDNAGCKFGYRDSVFKNELKDKTFITSATFALSKKYVPIVGYGALQERLAGFAVLTPMLVRRAILALRFEKIPDVKQYGNAGSFFKNPDISPEEARKLAVKHPEVKMFEQEDGMFKIPAGQLIDLCGFKRTPDPTVGVAYTNALIVMNLGGAKGKEILEFAKKIKKAVKQRFGIKLEPEVVVV